MSRNKGARGEREVANLFKAAGYTAQRTVGQTRFGGDNPDVQVKGLAHMWIEVKLGKTPNIEKAIEQAEAAKGKDQVAIAITRKDHKEHIVSMRLQPFFDLLGEKYPEIKQMVASLATEEASGLADSPKPKSYRGSGQMDLPALEPDDT